MYKKRRSDYLLDGLVIILFLLMCIPQLRILSGYTYFCFVNVLAIFIYILLMNRSVTFKKSPVLFLFLVYTIITCTIPLFYGNIQMFNRYVSVSEGFVFYMIYDYNRIHRGNSANIKLLVVLLALLIYPIISTLLALAEDGHACRAIKTTFMPGDETYFLLLSGVLGYELIYSVMLMGATFFCLFLFGNEILNRKLKIICIFIVATFSVLVVMSNYFTATILLFISYLIAYVLKKGARILVLIIPLLIIYGIAGKVINDAVIETVLYVLPEGRTHQRFALLLQSRQGSGGDEVLDARKETNESSIDLMLDYPFLGYISAEKFDLSKVGQHSYMLDTMALYGLLVGLLGCYTMGAPYIAMLRKERNVTYKKIVLLSGCMYIFLLFRNNLTLTIGCSAYFVFPTIFCYMRDIRKTNRKESKTMAIE